MSWIKNTHRSTLSFATQKKKQKQFLWLISSICFIAFGYSIYQNSYNYLLLIIGGFGLTLSFTFPLLTLPFLYIWMFIGGLLSEITSTIMLGIIYFLILTPIGLAKKTNQKNDRWVSPDKETNFNEQF